MKLENYLGLILLALILLAMVGCASLTPNPTLPPARTPNPTTPPTQAINTPAPVVTLTPSRDAPVANTPARSPTTPSSLPAPGDGTMERGTAFVDAAELRVLESFPPKIMLGLQGSLPTPCHQLRVQVSSPDRENKIRVEVYSVSTPGAICIQVLAPFDTTVSLGSFPKGKYTVWVNDKQVGTFEMP